MKDPRGIVERSYIGSADGDHVVKILQVGETWSWNCSCGRTGYCVATEAKAARNGVAHWARNTTWAQALRVRRQAGAA